MKKLIFAALAIMLLSGCGMTGKSVENQNDLKKSPCACGFEINRQV